MTFPYVFPRFASENNVDCSGCGRGWSRLESQYGMVRFESKFFRALSKL